MRRCLWCGNRCWFWQVYAALPGGNIHEECWATRRVHFALRYLEAKQTAAGIVAADRSRRFVSPFER